MKNKLLEVYHKMHDYFGDLNWWPGDTPFEIIIGAILTQNTAWTNVEKAIINLKKAGVLSFEGIRQIEQNDLAQLIRPSGYYNEKAKKLKFFLQFLEENYEGSIDKMAAEPIAVIRPKLLEVKGIGPETADSIILYALYKPTFVVDAYTRRIFSRHGFFPKENDYHQIQAMFMGHLEHDVILFNEYHAQIVFLGKTFCKPKPACDACPLNGHKHEII